MSISLANTGQLLGLLLSTFVAIAPHSNQSSIMELEDTPDERSVSDWIRNSAIAINNGQTKFGELDLRFGQSRVVALGEATHGQHEVFELKRQITMHLIEKHGFRLVAYEASVSKLIAANDYISGKNIDRRAALAGFGMLIWQIEENGNLLDDLRAWNQKTKKDDHVRLIGFDAQDSRAALNSLKLLVVKQHEDLYGRALDLHSRSSSAVQQLISGNRNEWDQYALKIEGLEKDLKTVAPTNQENSERYALFVDEFISSLKMYSSKGTRDRVMANLLMKQLEQSAPETRCVVWAHNGHIQRSPLRYLGSDELAMGGHVSIALGKKYYALGVAFGQGEFQANVPLTGSKWGFRRYHLSPSPKGSLEAMLGTAGYEMFGLDLLSAPKTQAIQNWLKTGQGQRWYGGYAVPDDCDAISSQLSNLMPTIPSEDFDGLLYVSKTTAATPIDLSLLNP